MLRYLTAGESHGTTLIALVDGFPAGVTVDLEPINFEVKRRQGGYGRGGRQRIETDAVNILSGVWRGVTLGSPIALEVPNRDAKLDRLDDLPRPIELISVASHERDARSFRHQLSGDDEAEPAGATGDEHRSSAEIERPPAPALAQRECAQAEAKRGG